MGNTIFFWRCIGIAQYLDYRSIGYWRYLSICRKMPLGRPETHFSLIFDQLPGAQEMDDYRIFEMLPLTTLYEKMVTFSCLISFRMWLSPPKCKQKERFEGTFDIARTRCSTTNSRHVKAKCIKIRTIAGHNAMCNQQRHGR